MICRGKVCIECKQDKELSDFYKHSGMSDGHLNKCKECVKRVSKKREQTLRSTPEGLESLRARGREKGKRLRGNWKNNPEARKRAIDNYNSKYPEKRKARWMVQYDPCKEGCELHHWSYREEHWKDVIELTIEDHSLLHRYMEYDQKEKMYRRIDNGELLDSSDKHLYLLKELKQ